MRRKRLQRRKRRLTACMFFICCILCFLCGFRFRGTQTVALAESRLHSSISEELVNSDLTIQESEAPREKYYTSIIVHYGDTLYDIAVEHMTEEYNSIDDYISEIKAINHMFSNNLEQGVYLTIPYYA